MSNHSIKWSTCNLVRKDKHYDWYNKRSAQINIKHCATLLLVGCAKRDAQSSEQSTSDGNKEPPSVGKAIVSFLKEVQATER
ncbi:hypothetical protein UB51_17290 [Paenibacillus sp. IHBB 10380]|nr:hypothetical protein UB51_17290 [Paenibacillus sp. IHBB 10380]